MNRETVALLLPPCRAFAVLRRLLAGTILCGLVSRGAAAADAGACRDESETGLALSFEDVVAGTVLIRVREEHVDDYPGFAIEPSPRDRAPVRFLVGKSGRRIEPEVLLNDRAWAPLSLEPAADSLKAFTVETQGRRTVVRLWDPERGRKEPPPAVPRDDRTEPTYSTISGLGPLALASRCQEVCYSPRNDFCYDFDRLTCYINAIADHPFARVTILGWSRPCPGQLDHVPREIYKLRITDPAVPRSEKVRVVLTGRVHGGERISSFLLEGIIDYALGYPVLPQGGSGLPELPELPADLLRRFELVIYPMLNPDGSTDFDDDGQHNFSRYKCGIDMNRRWGTSQEKLEAYEVHLVHQDILAEAALKPFVFHRDFHDWSKGFQGGFRHGIGTFRDELGLPDITVGQGYFDRESAYFLEEERRIPHRRVENYFVNEIGSGPIPGSARFALFRELGTEGLLTNTSESSYEILDDVVTSSPVYVTGDDVKHEGAWLLIAIHDGFSKAPEPQTFIRGDANRDGAVDLSDAIKVLLHLFSGSMLECFAAADLDQSSSVELTDVVYLLDFEFSDGPPPPLPFPTRGPPLPNDGLSCSGH